jgi:hypothetical protein
MSVRSSILLFSIEYFWISFANDWNNGSKSGSEGCLSIKKEFTFWLKGLDKVGFDETKSNSSVLREFTLVLSILCNGNDLNWLSSKKLNISNIFGVEI